MFKRTVACLLACMVFVFNFVVFVPALAEADEFDALREKWIETLTGGTDFDVNDPLFAEQIKLKTDAAQSRWDSMDKTENRTYLWSDLESATSSAQVTSNYGRIYEMALAYKTKGSLLENNQALLKDITDAMQWMNENRYNTENKIYDNWWDWDIGSPRHINNVLCLLYHELPEEMIKNYANAVERYVPDVTKANTGSITTGANRVWICGVFTIQGILVKDADKIAQARDALAPVFEYVTGSDGFYEDGSFIQHGNIAYTGGYGRALIDDISKLLYLLNGSKWEITAPSKENVYKWIYDSYEPIVYKGFLMDMVSGREIARYQRNGHTAGQSLMSALVILSQTAPEAHKAAFGGMVRAWYEQNTYMDFYKGLSIFTVRKARELIAESTPRESYRGVKIFPAMDRAVMHRDGFALGLAMYSGRTAAYESLNRENLLGFYTAAGTVYLHNSDQTKYADDYWATVDAYRLPGVTALQGLPISNSIGNDFAGGAVLNDQYGAVGFKFVSNAYSMVARKSYFMFDDEIVAIGTVTSLDEIPAETTMENYKINGDNVLTVDGGERAAANGETDVIENPKWMHLAGNTSGSDIGFYLPEPATVKALRETRTSSWSSVNKNYTTPENLEEKTRSYLTIWQDHGIAPEEKTYAYAMLPNKSAGEVEAYSQNPDFEVLANNEYVQVVRENKLGVTAANFFEDDEAAGIRCSTRASVIMKQDGNELEIAVSDPTQANKRNIVLEIDKAAAQTVWADPNVTVLAYSPKLIISVDTSQKRGLSSNIKIALHPPLSFEDLPQTHWAYGYVTALFNKNILQGKSETSFAPNDTVSREEFVKMMVDALGILDPNAECSFTDAQKDAWYYPYVASAAGKGIVQGKENGTFGLGEKLTRQEIAAVIYRSGIELEKKVLGDSYTDQNAIASWAKDAVTAVSRAKIMSGYQDGSFKPDGYVTRAEAAKVIFEVLQAKG